MKQNLLETLSPEQKISIIKALRKGEITKEQLMSKNLLDKINSLNQFSFIIHEYSEGIEYNVDNVLMTYDEYKNLLRWFNIINPLSKALEVKIICHGWGGFNSIPLAYREEDVIL